ncbi:MAG: hypothetical protein RIS47_1113 [Bacteroidota bacterium]
MIVLGIRYFQNCLFVLLLVFGFSLGGLAQDCAAAEDQTLAKFPILIQQKAYNEAFDMLDAWEASCGYDVFIGAGHALIDLKTRRYEQSFAPVAVLDCLDAIDMIRYDAGLLVVPNLVAFLDAIAHAAADNMADYTGSDERYLAFRLTRWNENTANYVFDYKDSPLFLAADAKLLEQITGASVTYGVGLGAFIPTKSSSFLGNHALFGFSVYSNYPNKQFGLSVQLRFGDTKKPYMVFYDDLETVTSHYVSGFFAFEFGQRLLGKRSHTLWASVSAGYEFIEAIAGQDLDGDGTNDLSAKVLHSFSLGFGPKYLYRSSGKYSFALAPRYIIPSFRNSGGTYLSDPYFSLEASLLFRLDWGM